VGGFDGERADELPVFGGVGILNCSIATTNTGTSRLGGH
jgi:hypothetical protein